MCDICRSNPCITGCPNKEYPVYQIGSCDKCGHEITSEDEEYLNYNGTYLCENCLAEFTLKGEDYEGNEEDNYDEQ